MAMASSVASACSAVSFPVGGPASSSARPRAAAGARVGVLRASAAKSGGSGKWWAPLLGWSAKADCLGRIYWCPPAPAPAQDEAAAARQQFVGVMTTEEKARELRARMAQTESFHDAM